MPNRAGNEPKMKHVTAEVVDVQTNGYETAFVISVDNRYLLAVQEIFDAVKAINEKAEADEVFQTMIREILKKEEMEMDKRHMDFLERKYETPDIPDEVDHEMCPPDEPVFDTLEEKLKFEEILRLQEETADYHEYLMKMAQEEDEHEQIEPEMYLDYSTDEEQDELRERRADEYYKDDNSPL